MAENHYDKKTKLIINKPLDFVGMGLSKEVKSLVFETDDEGNIKAIAVLPVDPTGAKTESQASTGYFNPVTGLPEYARTPTIWKNAGTNAGSVVAWTPTIGKKFRILGFVLSISKDAAAAAAEAVAIKDGGTTIISIDLSSAALVATGVLSVISFNFPGNGYLSAAINNVVNLVLAVNLTAGWIDINLWGTEE